MKFAKLQATGNDFVLIEASEERNWSSLAKSMCKRHFGIGADGLIVLLPSAVANVSMRMFNPDGSEAETCGNGLICLARYALDKGLVDIGGVSVETIDGLKKVHAQGDLLQVDIGLPRFRPEEIPVSIEDKVDRILDHEISVKDKKLPITCVSMGNPHAVHLSSEPVANFPLAELGPEVERHPMYPNRTNFEVGNVMSPQRIIARVWERGVGETLSCGTAACAVVVAAHLHDYVDNEVDVILPGGMITIDWDGTGEVKLRGPAEIAFCGEWPEGEQTLNIT